MANSEVSVVPKSEFENPPVVGGSDDNAKVDDSDNSYVFVNELDTVEDIKPLPHVDRTTEGNSFVHLNEEPVGNKECNQALSVTETKVLQVDTDTMVEDPTNSNSSGDFEPIQQSQDLVLRNAECQLHQLGDSNTILVEKAEQVAQVEEENQESHSEILKLDVPDSSCSEQGVGEASIESIVVLKENQETVDMVSSGVQSVLGDEELVELVSEITPAGPHTDLRVEVASFETEEHCPSDIVKDIVPETETDPINGSVEKNSTESNLEEPIQEDIAFEIPTEGPLVQIGADVANRSASFEAGSCLPTNAEEGAVQQITVTNGSVDETQNVPKPNDFIKTPESLHLHVKENGSEVEVVDISSAVDVITPVGNDESFVIGSNGDMAGKLDMASGPSLLTEDFQSSAADDMVPGDAPKPAAISSEHSSSPLVEGREAGVEDGFSYRHDISRCSDTGNRSEHLNVLNFNNDEVETHNFSLGDVSVEQKASDIATERPSSPSVSNGDLKTEFNSEDLAEPEGKLIISPVVGSKSEADAENMSASQGRDATSEVDIDNKSALQGRDATVIDTSVSEAEASNGFADNSESSLKFIPAETDHENRGDHCPASDAGAEPICHKNEHTPEVQVVEIVAAPKGFSADTSDGHTADAEVERKPFYYMIRIPRYDDENVREQIKIAQQEVEKKTQIRDAIRSEIQKRREICQRYSDALEAALLEERTARGILNSKRKEIDSAQSVINKVKNAMSVEDINYQIRNMEHRMQHETLPLIEEKQLIREIKKLNHFRETLSSSMGRPEELKQALDQKDEIEERLKVLKKEMDPLRDNSLKAELAAKAARKKYYEEIEIFRKLQAEFKAADITRQKAYTLLLSLRKDFYEKNKYFRAYKDEEKAAHDYADSRDNESLQRLCINQVETVMELWNKNDEFRKEYIRCNTRSTLRRLRTNDGRSLGPDEEPPALLNTRINKTTHLPAESKPVSVPPSDHERSEIPVNSKKDESVEEVVKQEKQTVETKCPTEPTILENVSPTLASSNKSEELKEEKLPSQTKEEEELARKEEEVRKKEEEEKLKEQRRLEEKLKAKEALERKKRNLEKAQARAELRAQKEAEQREKEKEKRARRKERKKAEVTSGDIEGDSVSSTELPTEISKESEMREKPITGAKKSQKTSNYTRQMKTKSVPLPIRNRGRRKMLQSWLWVLLPCLLVIALFVLGNSSLSFRLGRQNFHI